MSGPRALDPARTWLIWTLALYAVLGLLAWIAQGCRPAPERTRDEARAISATVRAWREAGHDSCPSAERLSVLHARDGAEMRSWCGVGPDQAASCLHVGYRLVVLAPGQELKADGEPVVHEALHLLILCEQWPDPDAGHTRRDVWRARGPGTVQERAQAIFAGG